jgi:hypothetical protein
VTVYTTPLVAVIIDDVCFAADANGSRALLHIGRYRRTTIKKYRPERKGRRSFGAAIEYGTVAMREKTWTRQPTIGSRYLLMKWER